jgi:hypothetical protein
MLKKLRDVEQLPEPEALEFLALPPLGEENDGEDTAFEDAATVTKLE